MKNVLGITGMILIVLAQQLFGDDDGLRASVIFLGATLCFCVLFLMARTTIDRLVAESSREYYLQVYEEYMNRQQEVMRNMEEELMKYRKG